MKPQAEETQPFTCCPLGICALCGKAVKAPFSFKMPGLKKAKPDPAPLTAAASPR